MGETNIKTGDIVQHRTGEGPKMTVGASDNLGYHCTYWSGSEKGFVTTRFKAAELTVITSHIPQGTS
jgi:uncharacterized protein YodC (DUF2158 family)